MEADTGGSASRLRVGELVSDRIRSSVAYGALAVFPAQVSALARRHKPHVWLLWAAGFALVVCTPAALVDPGILALALDPELIALIVLSSVALLRARAVGATLRLLPRQFSSRARNLTP